ncbi:MBL fold metallo-hydrolase [Labedaea rhizosphaerae]|uniref:Ribonuclease BN (tRNA processing enzyme) n=1 Tax=Labedaea rhizosphaerae TaxID=598644 RepID=A0A4V3D0H9_LABRH|nr:MBL fold metallo-hydrolase [Labedaea rhizosphaerae]TDQ05925.1 ribonuclease BN (tRNA processing enzyme) [Labedaea rhizosphaerae]
MRRLTVLGSCGAHPEAGSACSGFLLAYDDLRIVLDLGFATFPRLLDANGSGAVGAVVITHSHSDHCVDLNALFRERAFVDGPRIPLYCPPDVVSRVEPLEPRAQLSDVFDVFELPGTHHIGSLRVDGVLLPHYVPNAGIRLTAPGFTLAYTGDTAPCDELATLGADADLYIVDSTFLDDDTRGSHTLLTAREAGAAARAAGAKRLLLTHFWPGTDRSAAVAQAAEEFTGEVIAARDGLVLEL